MIYSVTNGIYRIFSLYPQTSRPIRPDSTTPPWHVRYKTLSFKAAWASLSATFRFSSSRLS